MWKRWVQVIRQWAHHDGSRAPRIGLALGGGFARCLAHVGVLETLERERIPIHAIAGISSGAVIASGFASGKPLEEMISTGACTTFNSYARWTLSRMGLASNERMEPYLRNTMPVSRFEQMRIPLAVVATDLISGAPVVFRDRGDIIAPVRASCAYPGLFLPVEIDGRWLVDGAVSVNVPVQAVVEMGATHVIAVYLHSVNDNGIRPTNLFQVVSQCFAIMQDRMMVDWRRGAELVLEPEVAGYSWNDFERAPQIVEAGRRAAEAALPQIREWFRRPSRSAAPVRAIRIPRSA